jgi:hypothetical protein
MYDLFNDKSEISFNFFDWGHVLELALHYGWTPMGSEQRDLRISKDWKGGYTSNDWQYVLPEDAINIAKALEKALMGIPDIDVSGPLNSDIIVDGNSIEDIGNTIFDFEKAQRGLPVELLLKKFSGKENKEYIKRFIDFCNEGCGFTIS